MNGVSRRRVSKHERGDRGFTLVELMVTIGCMAVLGAVAVPRLRGYILESRLNGAKPYLMEIAARQRMYKVETGKYCCTAYDGTDETALATALPTSIAEAGDFCFVFVCRDSALCEKPNTARSFVDTTTTPDFEVWAVLRNSSTASSVGTYGGPCTPATGTSLTKATPTGWVQTGSTAAGRAGQAVVLRYPPPPNGQAASNASYHAVRLTWQDGTTTTDALLP